MSQLDSYSQSVCDVQSFMPHINFSMSQLDSYSQSVCDVQSFMPHINFSMSQLDNYSQSVCDVQSFMPHINFSMSQLDNYGQSAVMSSHLFLISTSLRCHDDFEGFLSNMCAYLFSSCFFFPLWR